MSSSENRNCKANKAARKALPPSKPLTGPRVTVLPSVESGELTSGPDEVPMTLCRGITPVTNKPRSNNVEALMTLVRNGADVSLPCKLPWANGRTAEGLAELEGQRAALSYLRRLRVK
jgi:hypothetical protein